MSSTLIPSSYLHTFNILIDAMLCIAPSSINLPDNWYILNNCAANLAQDLARTQAPTSISEQQSKQNESPSMLSEPPDLAFR